MMKIKIVLMHPPPSLLAPQPAKQPRAICFMRAPGFEEVVRSGGRESKSLARLAVRPSPTSLPQRVEDELFFGGNA